MRVLKKDHPKGTPDPDILWTWVSRGFLKYNYVLTKYALVKRRGSESPSCEDHHMVLSNKCEENRVNPRNKDIILYQ